MSFIVTPLRFLCVILFPHCVSSSHRSFFLQHDHHGFYQYLHIQSDIPVLDIFLIESYHFLEIRDIASSADLPHAGDSRLDCQSRFMPRLIQVGLRNQRRSCGMSDDGGRIRLCRAAHLHSVAGAYLLCAGARRKERQAL